MKILITGGAGFLGSWITRLALARGDEVIIPRSIDTDLRDPHVARTYLADHHPDLVIHLAARVGGIGANQKHPGRFFYDNLAMGLSVLEAARQTGVRKVVTVGTVCSYPKFAPVPFKEDDLWNGYPEETNAPYGEAKRALLVMSQAYRQEFGSNFVFVIPVNLYGPGDNFDPESSHVIPAMIRKFVEARDSEAASVTLWGDGTPSREFLYVEDAAEGILAAADQYNGPLPINLGTGIEIDMLGLAVSIGRLVGYHGQLKWDTSKPNGQPRRVLDVSRASELLGWKAHTSFAEGLSRTITWYEESRKKPQIAPRCHKTALITGVTGQDGSYLAEFLLDKGYQVHGIIRRSSSFNTARVDHLMTHPGFRLHFGDLTDGSSLQRILTLTRPDEVYHLGAQSHVRVSFDIPDYTCEATGMSTLRLLEAIRSLGLPCRVYQASSSELFGLGTPPYNENTPFHPRSPYGAAKAHAFFITQNYREAYGMFAVNGILFNHESERRGETFVTRKITRAVGRIKHGLQTELVLGNLEAQRDWGYAPDYVEAMWLMLQQDKPEDFVIGTGETHSVQEFVEKAFGQVGLDWEQYVRTDPRYLRPSEVDVLIADPTKARIKLGWQPKVTFGGLVARMVEHDLELANPEAHTKRHLENTKPPAPFPRTRGLCLTQHKMS